MTIKGSKGSVTVEAAIALPVFICVIVTAAFLIKIVYVHEVIQHSITQTANEMATASYLYKISGIMKVHDDIRDRVDSGAGLIEKHLSEAVNLLGYLKNLKEDTSVNFPEEVAENIEAVVQSTGGIIENPLEELESAAYAFSKAAFSDIKTQACIPIVKLYITKYLKTPGYNQPDKRLKALNVIDGFDGLDFGLSSFFEDKENNIDIIVRYRLDIPIPIKIVPGIQIVQRATVKAWLGRNTNHDEGLSDNEEDIWGLDNFQRGSRLREIFGGDLPFNFPVIAKFQEGKATMIKSMDLTAASYQNEEAVLKRIREFISILSAYKGQERPWGSKEIVIKEKDIRVKELLLIIPTNVLNPEIERVLEKSIMEASASGISMRVERYGTKRVNSEIDNGQEAEKTP